MKSTTLTSHITDSAMSADGTKIGFLRMGNGPGVIDEKKAHATLRAVPTAALMPGALKLALKGDVSAYDDCYLALAGELKAPLATADQKLFRRLKDGTAFLKWIGDYPEK